MTGIILAGGRNSRIRTGKAFLKIGGKTIIKKTLDKFRKIFSEVIIVTNNFLEYQNSGARLVKDIIPDKGPLGGIYSGLVSSESEYNFVVACDMPFLNVELIKYIKNNCDGFDVIIPRLDRGYETLHAIYSKNCIVPIEKQLKQDNLKIIDFFLQVRIKKITEEIVQHFDPGLVSFFNINTNVDYQKAVKIALCHMT